MLFVKRIALTAMVLLACSAYAQTPFAPKADERSTPGFNNKIPKKIMTPDTVQTRIGRAGQAHEA